jgi:lactate dehydrogenase-like 2-hydroxyacid dehydrogenase
VEWSQRRARRVVQGAASFSRVSRILISTPLVEDCLAALRAHELIEGAPGEDSDVEALICPPTVPVTAAAIAAMPGLRVIAVAGAGTDAVDLDAATARGIEILTAGEALVETTADLAFALILAASRTMGEAESKLRGGRWDGWGFMDTQGRDVHGATLGLVGYGRIARAVARRAKGFSMTVLHHARSQTSEPGWREDLDAMLVDSDIVSVHVPLTESTRGLIDARRIALIGPGGVLVNTARGAVIDEFALAGALERGELLAAGLDVYEYEPLLKPELLAAPRAVLLPHIGSATEATRRAMLSLAAERVAAFLGDGA